MTRGPTRDGPTRGTRGRPGVLAWVGWVAASLGLGMIVLVATVLIGL